MRIVNFILFLLMILFMLVQYNDPDGPLWVLIYSIPAIWAALAAFRPGWMSQTSVQALLLLSMVAVVYGIYHYWPTTPQWWTQAVWWETETAREGMGMMIVGLVTMLAWLGGRLYRGNGNSGKNHSGEDHARI